VFLGATETPKNLKKKLRAFRPSPCQGKRGGGDNKAETHYSRNKRFLRATELQAFRFSPCQGKRGDDKEGPDYSKNKTLLSATEAPGTQTKNAGVPAFSPPRQTQWW